MTPQEKAASLGFTPLLDGIRRSINKEEKKVLEFNPTENVHQSKIAKFTPRKSMDLIPIDETDDSIYELIN